MKIGKDIYTILKRNNTAMWLISGFFLVVTSVVLFWSFTVYKESQQNMYAINEKGELVPLIKLDEKKDKIKQVQANLDYFVSLYYDLDGYTMKDKKEKILWLVGKQPTTVIRDRDKKGYFNTFLSITGLNQHAKIDQASWKFNSLDAPYTVSFTVDIVRFNGDVAEYYKCNVLATLEVVNRNYPYNPYGLIISRFDESLQKIEKNEQYENDLKTEENNNQNN